MLSSNSIKRLLISLLAFLQLTLPGFAGISMCGLGMASEECCCAIVETVEFKGCCTAESSQDSDAQRSESSSGEDCDCARAPEQSPLQFPEVVRCFEADVLSFVWLAASGVLLPVTSPSVSSWIQRRPPPAWLRPLLIWFQVFRL